MTASVTVEFEVISRSVLTGRGGRVEHTLNLLNRGNAHRGHNWQSVPAGLALIVPPDFEAEAGEFLEFELRPIDKSRRAKP